MLTSALLLLFVAQSPAGYDQIVGHIVDEPRLQVCGELEAWLTHNPQDPNAGRALIWLGQQYALAGELAKAKTAYQRARDGHPGTEWALGGTKGLAEIAMSERHYGEAADLYDELAARPDPLWNYLGKMGAHDAHVAKTRFQTFVVALLLLLLLNLTRLFLARGGLRDGVPREVWFVLPVSLLLSFAALGQERDEARAVISVAMGGLFLVFCNALFFRARPPRGLARPRELLIGIVQTAALLYCAIVANGLWQKLVDTIDMGPG